MNADMHLKHRHPVPDLQAPVIMVESGYPDQNLNQDPDVDKKYKKYVDFIYIFLILNIRLWQCDIVHEVHVNIDITFRLNR